MKENLLQQKNLTWAHYSEDADHPFPVSYWGTILDIDDVGHISVLYRWDPEHFCHFHRHLCATTSLVLEGELHVKTFENGELSTPLSGASGTTPKNPRVTCTWNKADPTARWYFLSCTRPTVS